MADFTRLFSLFIMHFVVAQLQGKEHLEPKFCNLGKYTIFSCKPYQCSQSRNTEILLQGVRSTELFRVTGSSGIPYKRSQL